VNVPACRESRSRAVFSVDELPLGLQVMGFADRDADLFGIAAWLRDLL
jgi:Asp-tRNA(Asn)/Glu-tRNA(Gln) amidotransferase A subunit family amidase